MVGLQSDEKGGGGKRKAGRARDALGRRGDFAGICWRVKGAKGTRELPVKCMGKSPPYGHFELEVGSQAAGGEEEGYLDFGIWVLNRQCCRDDFRTA